MRDLRYEQFLNKSGVPWHYEEKIALSQVNEVESFKNQARYQVINDDVVTKYAVEMLDDLDKDTVDWQENYDQTRQEPLVLPAKLPNL